MHFMIVLMTQRLPGGLDKKYSLGLLIAKKQLKVRFELQSLYADMCFCLSLSSVFT